MKGITNSTNIKFAINGVIEQYTSLYSGVISANSFVQFVNTGDWETTSPVNLYNDSHKNKMTALALSDIQAVVLYIDTTSSKLYATPVKILNGVLTVGTSVNISGTGAPATAHPSYYIDADRLSSGAFIVAYNVASDSYWHLMAVVCTVSNNVISAGTPTQITSQTVQRADAYVTALGDSAAIICANGTAYACAVSGTSVTNRNSVSVYNPAGELDGVDIVSLSSKKAIHVGVYNSANTDIVYHLGILGLTSSGYATITSQTITLNMEGGGDAKLIVTPLSNDHILIAMSGASFGGIASLVEINGTTATVAGEIQQIPNSITQIIAQSAGSIVMLGGKILYTYTLQDDTLAQETATQLFSSVGNGNGTSFAILPTNGNAFIIAPGGADWGDNNPQAIVATPDFSAVLPYKYGQAFGFGVAQNTALTNEAVNVMTK